MTLERRLPNPDQPKELGVRMGTRLIGVDGYEAIVTRGASGKMVDTKYNIDPKVKDVTKAKVEDYFENPVIRDPNKPVSELSLKLGKRFGVPVDTKNPNAHMGYPELLIIKPGDGKLGFLDETGEVTILQELRPKELPTAD